MSDKKPVIFDSCTDDESGTETVVGDDDSGQPVMIVDVRADYNIKGVDTDGADTTFHFNIVKGGCKDPSLVTQTVFRDWIDGSPPRMEMLSYYKRQNDALSLPRLGLLFYTKSIEECDWRLYIFSAAEELALVHSFISEISADNDIPKFSDADIIRAGKPVSATGVASTNTGKFKKIHAFLENTHIASTSLSPFAYAKLVSTLPRRRKQDSPKRKQKDGTTVPIKKSVPLKRKREVKDVVGDATAIPPSVSAAASSVLPPVESAPAKSVPNPATAQDGPREPPVVTIHAVKDPVAAVQDPTAISATFTFTDANTFMSCIDAIFNRRSASNGV